VITERSLNATETTIKTVALCSRGKKKAGLAKYPAFDAVKYHCFSVSPYKEDLHGRTDVYE